MRDCGKVFHLHELGQEWLFLYLIPTEGAYEGDEVAAQAAGDLAQRERWRDYGKIFCYHEPGQVWLFLYVIPIEGAYGGGDMTAGDLERRVVWKKWSEVVWREGGVVIGWNLG